VLARELLGSSSFANQARAGGALRRRRAKNSIAGLIAD